MKRNRPAGDETVLLAPGSGKPARAAASRGAGALLAIAAAGALLGAGFVAAWLLVRGPAHGPATPVQTAPAAVGAPDTAGAPAAVPSQAAPAPSQANFAIVTGSVETIRRNTPASLSIFRLAENPNIVVLDFASLAQQARMLDRVAALTEKKGQPRDRILSPAELDHAVSVDGNPSGWFYYGHDYSAGELNRFFDIAARDAVALTAEEALLERLMVQLGWRNATTSGALISLPRPGADANVTADARDTILMHELSHGAYFSNPAYADYVHRFWQTALTAAEREGLRAYLAREGYDRGVTDLMENEAQAYLFFTADPAFFTARDAGLTTARREELRARFLRDMPAGWLKDLLARL